jgi:predicted signal transduction protein with EAL and GGDEF domain
VVIAHRDAQGGIERRDLVDAVLQPFQLTVGVGVQIGCSLGIDLGTGDDAQPVQLPARVDQALCEAKRAGRGQVALAASGDGGSGAVA